MHFPAQRSLFFISFVFFSFQSSSQSVHGSVFNEQGHLLPYASVFIKGSTQGVTANGEGRFHLILKPGTYILVCQHVGYAKQERKITLEKNDEEIIFILPLQKFQLKEIHIKSGDADPAYEIIRQAIKKRSFYNNQVRSFESEAYIKGLVKLRSMPDRILGRKVPEEDKKEMRLDSSGKGIIFLSESITKVAMQQPGKMKLEVISGRQSGSSGFGFNFPTFISLYQNNVSLFTSRLNPRGFVSPIADNALNYYRYKFIGSFFEDGKEINSIRVIPKHNYEPVFSGIINITEGDWRIHSCDLLLTKTSQLELLDSLQLTQIHVPINDETWRVKNQLVHFNFKQFGIDAVGNFVNVYSKYNLDPKFPKNYFDRVIITYDTSVNKKTTEYWDSIRPVPLEPEEIKDYKIKDSIYLNEKDSANTLNIDSLKKGQGPVTFKQIVLGGIDRTHYATKGNYRWHVDPLITSLQYNTVEGLLFDINGSFRKYLKNWKTNLTVTQNIRYGFGNNMLNAWLRLNFRTNDTDLDKKLKREEWSFSGGTRISQFNKESNITALGNSISTLFFGNNNLKIYKNVFSEISFTKRFESGFRFSINALYEDRIPLDNTTDFVIIDKNRSKLTPNYPYRILSSQFNRHQALIAAVDLSVKPGQRYIQFPKSKVAIGSEYPTFSLNLSHGFKDMFGSDVDFDKWMFTIADEANLKLAGSIKYKVSFAGFLNNSKVFIQDYQFFNGNESRVAKEYMNTFQLLPYYSAYTISHFYSLLNFEHHLNGLLSNKLPLFKRLSWTFVNGANAFYIDKNDNYVEIFAGVENIFKLFRIDVVAGSRNGQKINVDYRIGLGGSIGSAVNTTVSRSNNVAF
ncbi:MAG TPA: DUF5686 and carboxypeptidase regulatory-like domain-containing protein [Chitinophagaceae bacterium]|nr:DUF5686 and carboxypeptidase regulatory-like domain-containing protein [Chitinophagaceae bacterium]